MKKVVFLSLLFLLALVNGKNIFAQALPPPVSIPGTSANSSVSSQIQPSQALSSQNLSLRYNPTTNDYTATFNNGLSQLPMGNIDKATVSNALTNVQSGNILRSPGSESMVINNPQAAAAFLYAVQQNNPNTPSIQNPQIQNLINSYSNSQPLEVPNQKEDKPTPVDLIVNWLLMIVKISLFLTAQIFVWLIQIAGKTIDFFYGAQSIAGAETIQKGWEFTRDLLNFVFILALLAISFSHIAGLDTMQMKKMLPTLLFSALLVNFSLVICGAFLQTANIMTLTIAKSILPQEQGQTINQNNIGTVMVKGLMNAGNVSRYYTAGPSEWSKLAGLGETLNADFDLKKVAVETFKQANSVHWETMLVELFQFVAAVTMVGVFAVAFIALGGLMAVRLIVIAMLVVLSPIPFVFSVVPKAQQFAQKWWSYFINYVFFLPAVTFFLALAIVMLQKKDTNSNTADKQSNLVTEFGMAEESWKAGITGAVMDTIFVSLFVFIAIYMAKTLGIYGAGAVMSYAKSGTLGAAKLGMWPAKKVADYAGRKSGATGLYSGAKVGLASRKESREAAIRSGRSAQWAAGIMGGASAAEMLRNKEIEEARKGIKNKGEDELRSMLNKGGVQGAAAAMELLDNDDLDKKQGDFQKALSLMPKNSANYKKIENAWKKKDPINATLHGSGVSRNDVLTGAKKLTQKQVDDIQGAFKRIKPEDYAKLEAEDFDAALAAGVAMPMSKSQMNAVFDSVNKDLQIKASDYVKSLNSRAATLNPGEAAILKHATERLGVKP